MKHNRIKALFLCCLSACTSHNPWVVDSIASGNDLFDSARIRHTASHLTSFSFEMFRMGDQIEAFLNLNRRNTNDSVPITITLGEESIQTDLSLNEGRMRARLPSEMTTLIIQSLQNGTKVVIDLNGYEETLQPDQFSGSYSKFLKKSFLQNFIKVPL